MTRKLTLPDAPLAGDDRRMSAPSARRNMAPILEVLRTHAPTEGRVLEIAAGTGEHAVAFSRAFPGLDWQPTDLDPDRLASIEAWRQAEGPANLRPPVELNAATPGWHTTHGPADMILLVNLLHLIADAEAEAVLTGIAQALAPGGKAFLYGPFLRNGETTSEGDAAFHASLQAQDTAIGYKDIAWVRDRLTPLKAETVEMPSNNLMIIVSAN
jgi:SAM-dependent methyltransferase